MPTPLCCKCTSSGVNATLALTQTDYGKQPNPTGPINQPLVRFPYFLQNIYLFSPFLSGCHLYEDMKGLFGLCFLKNMVFYLAFHVQNFTVFASKFFRAKEQNALKIK